MLSGQEEIFAFNGNPFSLFCFISNVYFYQLVHVLKRYNYLLSFSVDLLSQYNPFAIILVAIIHFIYYLAFRLNILINLF